MRRSCALSDCRIASSNFETYSKEIAMKKRPRKLRIENLEERKLTAAVTWQLSSLFHAPQSGTALVSQPSAPSTSGLTYGFHNAGFKPGIALNHNETLVRLKRSAASRQSSGRVRCCHTLAPASD